MKRTTTSRSTRRVAIIGAVAALVLGVGTTAYACEGFGGGGGGFGGFGALAGLGDFGGDDFGSDDCGACDDGGGMGGGGGIKAAKREKKRPGRLALAAKPQAPLDDTGCEDEDYDNYQQVKKDKASGTFQEGDDDYGDMADEMPAAKGPGCDDRPQPAMPKAQLPVQQPQYMNVAQPKAEPAPAAAPKAQLPNDAPLAQPAPAKPAAQAPSRPMLPKTGVETTAPLQTAGGLIALGVGFILLAYGRRRVVR